MTTTRKQTRKTGEEPTTAKSRKKREDAEVEYFNTHFDADFRTAQSIGAHITAEEHCYLLGRCGMKYFLPSLLRVLGRANRRRDERLGGLLDKALPVILANVPASVAGPFAARIRERLDRYEGPSELAPMLQWIINEADFFVLANQAIRADAVQSVHEFNAIYAKGRDALLGGIRKSLATCLDLGADIGDEEHPGDTVSELEQRAWVRIWCDLPAWAAPGTASITTRLFAYGMDQAHGWKTERLRDRERLVRGLFDRDAQADDGDDRDAEAA